MVPYILGASNTVSASKTAGMTIIASTSDTTGTSRMLLILTLQGASNIAGTRTSVGTDNNPGASGSAGVNQLFPATYPVNPRDNLRMLEIMANMDAFGTPPSLPQMALCGSNTVSM